MSASLIWIDCEMTGLDPAASALVEVAALVTDGDLNVLGEGVDVLIRPEQSALDAMADVVREMHTASGLLDELESGLEMAEAEELVLAYVREHAPEPGRSPMAGNTIGTDRVFLARDMPRLSDWAHYRSVDVTSVKELAKRWFPPAYRQAPHKRGAHRALSDIQESIVELRYYRDTIFVDRPGPGHAKAARVARLHQIAASPAEPVDAEREAGVEPTSPE